MAEDTLMTRQDSATAPLLTIAESIQKEHSAWITEVRNAFGEVTLIVPREAIVDVCWFLKSRYDFDDMKIVKELLAQLNK